MGFFFTIFLDFLTVFDMINKYRLKSRICQLMEFDLRLLSIVQVGMKVAQPSAIYAQKKLPTNRQIFVDNNYLQTVY